MKNLRNILLMLVGLAISVTSFADKPRKYTRSSPYPKFTRADSLHGYLSEFRSCFDVQFYDIDIEIIPEKKFIQGNVTMTFVWKNSAQRVMQIDLSSLLTIDSLWIDGKRQTNFYRELNAVFVSLEEPFELDSEHSITCFYKGKPHVAPNPPWEGGFVWKTCPQGKPWIGVSCQKIGSNVWIPCKDHLSDEPDKGMQITMRVPLGLTAVSNGVLQSHKTTSSHEVWTWRTNYTINTYNITCYVGNYVHFGETFQGIETEFPLNYYVLPNDLEKAKKSFSQVPNVLRVMEKFYGPYPWANECYKLVESPYEGMEHQTAIAYGSSFKNIWTLFDYIILHESAHEWWGNSVSVDDYSDIVLQEGFAMYSEFLFVEEMYGKNYLEMYVNVWMNTINNIRPVVGPRGVNFWDYNDTDPYTKGAMALHGLRYTMNNDSLFFDILKTYNQSRKYTTCTVKDFTDYVNEKTNTDYSWYFQQYFYTAKPPELQWRWIPYKELDAYREKVDYILDETTMDEELAPVNFLQLRWANTNENFTLPLNMILLDSAKQQVKTKIYKGNKYRENPVENLVVTPQSIVVKRYGKVRNTLYFNKTNAYFITRNVKKFKK